MLKFVSVMSVLLFSLFAACSSTNDGMGGLIETVDASVDETTLDDSMAADDATPTDLGPDDGQTAIDDSTVNLDALGPDLPLAATSVAPTGGGGSTQTAMYHLRLTVGAPRPIAEHRSSSNYRLHLGPAFTTSPR